MRTPSNTELQALIDSATPGPWSNAAYTSPPSDDSEVKALTYERKAGLSIVHFNYIAEGMTSANAKLVALTQAIAAELITGRAEVDAWVEINSVELPNGLCGDRADHEPHDVFGSAVGDYHCTAIQQHRLPYALTNDRTKETT